jgi:hypothetical protein
MVDFNELFERYKQLIGLAQEDFTEEQLAEFDSIRQQIEAEGGQTGEAAPVTGTDLADAATSFGGGGIIKGGVTTVTKAGVKGAGKETAEILAKEGSKTITKQGTKLTPQATWGNIYKTVTKKAETNTKSMSLTRKILVGAGFTAGASAALLPIIGTYPFSGFIKEETFQTIDFAVKMARENGDIEGEREALAFKREMLDITAWENILGKIPFANVVAELKHNTEAALIKTNIDENDFNKRQEEADFVAGASRKELLEKQLETATTIEDKNRILKDLSFIEKDEIDTTKKDKAGIQWSGLDKPDDKPAFKPRQGKGPAARPSAGKGIQNREPRKKVGGLL